MSRDDVDEDDDLGDDEEEEEGELVERGTFSVDMAVAAEKLADFQLADAADFLIPWLRAAVASHAKRVSAGIVDGALTFQFDGDAPDPAVLGDLVSGLMVDGGPAARHLAYGALALQRLSPDALHAACEDGLTVLRVRWARRGPEAKALRRLREAYGMTRTVLTIDGEPVPDPAQADSPVKTWKGARMRGAVFADGAAAGDGRLRLYVFGALVETVPVNMGGRFTAHVTNDRFALSMSQSSVVKDARYEKVVRRLERLRRKIRQRGWTDSTEVRSWGRLAGIGAGAVAATWLGYWAAARLLLSN